MPTFYYKAKKGVETTISGQVTALNVDDAVERISQLGLVPVSVEDKLVQHEGVSVYQGSANPKEIYLLTK